MAKANNVASCDLASTEVLDEWGEGKHERAILVAGIRLRPIACTRESMCYSLYLHTTCMNSFFVSFRFSPVLVLRLFFFVFTFISFIFSSFRTAIISFLGLLLLLWFGFHFARDFNCNSLPYHYNNTTNGIRALFTYYSAPTLLLHLILH